MDIEELKNILLNDKPSNVIENNEEEIFSLIPELKTCKGFKQNNPWHIYDVYTHILKVVDNVPKDIRVRIAALFHDVGKPLAYTEDEKGIGHFYGHWTKSGEIFKDFSIEQKLDLELSKTVMKLIYFHDINFDKLNESEKQTVLTEFNKEELKLLFQIKRADLLAQNPIHHDLLESYNLQEKILLKYKDDIERDEGEQVI